MKDRLISDHSGYDIIMRHISSNNGGGLISALAVYYSPNELYQVDKNGNSLLKTIQESKIDLNKKQTHTSLLSNEVSLETPLETTLIHHAEYRFSRPFDKLKFLITLGVDLNLSIDDEENTVLHKCIQRKDIHPTILKLLFEGKGDFLKLNKDGKTPIDFADPYSKIYIQKLMAPKILSRESAALKMLHRSRIFQKKRSELKPIVLDNPLFNKPAKEPSSNPPDRKKMLEWVQKHEEKERDTAEKVMDAINHISFPHFLFGLKMATKKFNRYLSTLPAQDRKYVLLVDYRENKSGLWVTKLAEKFLSITPSVIITTKDLFTFEPAHDLKHILMLDDASYSGNFLCNFLSNYQDRILFQNNKLMNLKMHFIVPFVSPRSESRFQEYDVLIHQQENLPLFQIPGTKFFGKTANYFDHKLPEAGQSTIECLETGKLINGQESGTPLVKPIITPYK